MLLVLLLKEGLRLNHQSFELFNQVLFLNTDCCMLNTSQNQGPDHTFAGASKNVILLPQSKKSFASIYENE